MKIVVISTPHTLENEIKILVDLFRNGLDIFHLRKPDFSLKETQSYLHGIPENFHGRVILHDYHRLSDKYGLKGIHFTEARRTQDYENIIKIRKSRPGLHLSASFHHMDDVKNQGEIFDYLFLSPVFNSISKKNYRAAFDRKELEVFLNRTPCKVLALGGIDENNIKTAMGMGFSGAAVLGAVWNDKNPVNAYRRIKKAAEAA